MIISALVACLCSATSATAQPIECRTRCEANEIIDANGCCAAIPSARRPRPDVPPEEPSKPPETSWGTTLKIHHLSAPMRDDISREALIEAIGALRENASAGAAEERAALAWALLLSIEGELVDVARTCHEVSTSQPEERECIRGLEGITAQRDASLAIILPVWSALLDAHPDAVWRPQTRYYAAVGAMLLGKEEDALSRFEVLLEAGGPYASYAMVTVADRYFARGEHRRALPLYLKAQLSKDSQTLRAYGAYMEGWCRANAGDVDGAMRAMILGLERAQGEPQIQNREVLLRAIRGDITQIYAHAGPPEGAATFYEALGVPRALLPLSMMRLGRRYESLGKRDEALIVYRAIAKDSSEAKERLDLLERDLKSQP